MDERSERVAKRFELPLLVAALLVIPMLVLDNAHLGAPWPAVVDALNWGTWLVFLAELATMIAIVPDRRRWIREHPVDVLVTILTPPVLPSSLAAARLLRLLWVLRLARLAPIARRVFSLDAVAYAAVLTFITILAGGSAFAAVEHRDSEWDGIWWAVETMTTVGYGDIYPTTTAARIIAIVVMVVGVGFATLLIGSVAERFIAHEVDAEIELSEAELQHELREVAKRLERIELLMARRTDGG